jgi:hypothetical protein
MFEALLLITSLVLMPFYIWLLSWFVSHAYFWNKLDYHRESIKNLIELEETNGKAE